MSNLCVLWSIKQYRVLIFPDNKSISFGHLVEVIIENNWMCNCALGSNSFIPFASNTNVCPTKKPLTHKAVGFYKRYSINDSAEKCSRYFEWLHENPMIIMKGNIKEQLRLCSEKHNSKPIATRCIPYSVQQKRRSFTFFRARRARFAEKPLQVQ